jgi:hypothetical protein
VPRPAPQRSAAVPPARTTSSGIAVEGEQPADMMSTIEIQRTEGGAVEKLREGIRQAMPNPDAAEGAAAPAARHGQGQTSSGIEVTPPAEGPVDMLSTIEIQRSVAGGEPPRRSAVTPARGLPRPATPPPPAPAPGVTSSSSGIQVQQGSMAPAGMTGTVTLSRKGMGMEQKPRGAAPGAPASPARGGRPPLPPQPPRRPAAPAPAKAPAGAPSLTVNGPYAIVAEQHVSCPHCNESYEVPEEVYGALAECPDCGMEFTIVAPGTRVIAPAAAAPAAPPPAKTAAEPAKPAPRKTGEHAAPAAAAAPATAPAETPAPPKRDSQVLMLWGVVGLLVLLVLLLVVKQLGWL